MERVFIISVVFGTLTGTLGSFCYWPRVSITTAFAFGLVGAFCGTLFGFLLYSNDGYGDEKTVYIISCLAGFLMMRRAAV